MCCYRGVANRILWVVPHLHWSCHGSASTASGRCVAAEGARTIACGTGRPPHPVTTGPTGSATAALRCRAPAPAPARALATAVGVAAATDTEPPGRASTAAPRGARASKAVAASTALATVKAIRVPAPSLARLARVAVRCGARSTCRIARQRHVIVATTGIAFGTFVCSTFVSIYQRVDIVIIRQCSGQDQCCEDQQPLAAHRPRARLICRRARRSSTEHTLS